MTAGSHTSPDQQRPPEKGVAAKLKRMKNAVWRWLLRRTGAGWVGRRVARCAERTRTAWRRVRRFFRRVRISVRWQLRKSRRRVRAIVEGLAEVLLAVGLTVLAAFITAGMSLFLDAPPDEEVLWTLVKRWVFAAVAAFVAWGVGFVLLFNERRRADKAEERADRAERRVDELVRVFEQAVTLERLRADSAEQRAHKAEQRADEEQRRHQQLIDAIGALPAQIADLIEHSSRDSRRHGQS